MIKKIIAISMACLISGIGFPVSLVFALPQDGNIVGGQGTINQPTANDLVINQNTGNLIINWQGFSIGASESVRFIQPSVNSVALNRVVGTDPSLIAGRLSANGQVFITNPSGVIFLPGSQVDVHGLLATTLGISDQDFLNRTYNFFQDPSRSLASILNEGNINADFVGLLAPSVVNRGTIVANLGSVALASGTTATLDFIGDNLINFVITEEIEGTATDADGNVLDHNISNEGLIRADGGLVTLSVRRAGEIIKSVINQEGIIEARTVVNKEGRIFLSGGDNGIVSVTGTLDASGKGAGEKGGTIHVTGENVGLFETAKLDASGDIGGGEILVGGDRLGEGELQNAKATFIGEDVSINADAITNGDGGKLIVFAEDSAKIYGNLFARGGSVSGNGGFIETSGKQYFEISKTPDIGAPNGQGGEWLIDPYNIQIVSGFALSNINTISPFESFGDSATLGIDLILSGLSSGDVSITTGSGGSEAGNITWDSPLDFNNSTNNSTLSLDAIGSIFFNQSIFDSTPGGDVLNLVALAGISIIFNADITTQGSLLAKAPTVNLNSGYNLKSNNNPILVLADTFDSDNNNFVNTSINAGSSTITLAPFSTGTSFNIGTGPGILSLTDKDNPNLPDNFTTSSLLIFGISNTGPVTVNNVLIEQENVVINSGS
ncbi:MAG: filamentous hemagglutinin N-terminal domain-containing protein, partial [Nitrospinae bacterium]|nr:filamentous hemagglutinin N-terminal domain-containing protein [Nitrospinota bacterium]